MVQLVTRSGKGSALTISELDQNFINLSNAIDNVDLNNNSVNSQNDAIGLNRLSAVSSQALHRSPNAVTSMFIYDTSKDSDGGAWTAKCEDTSWYNETLSGVWLGQHDSELSARCHNAELGPDLITNSDFSNGTIGWTVPASVSLTIVGGVAKAQTISGADGPYFGQAVSVVAGTLYEVTFTSISDGTSDPARLYVGTFWSGVPITPAAFGTYSVKWLATTTGNVVFWFYGTVFGLNKYILCDNISVRKITNQISKANDYFQLTTDGKFYKLNENSGITEVFRGNKKEFPKIAAIIADGGSATSAITIYDLTELNYPMWMRFGYISGNSSLYGNGSTQDIKALNGIIAFAREWNTWGYNAGVVKFPHDSLYIGAKTDFPGHKTYVAKISDRNQNIYKQAEPEIFNNTYHGSVYAVDLIAKENAILNKFGLKEPTVIFGTLGGLSILEDGFINKVITSNPSQVYKINSYKNTLYIHGAYGSQSMFGFIKNFEKSLINYTTHSGEDPSYLSYNQSSYGKHILNKNLLITTAPTSYAGVLNSVAFQRTDFSLPDGTNNFKSCGVFGKVTGTWNKGYSIGDERRAYLVDSLIENISSTELIGNGTFNLNTNSWTLSPNATFEVINGEGVLTETSTTNAAAYQEISTIIGKSYVITFQARMSSSGDGRILIGTSSFSNNLGGVLLTTTQTQYSITFVPTTTTTYITIYSVRSIAGNSVTIDNISVRFADFDRSYKNKNIPIFGTLTKSPVASNAQLVAYSGWSNSNYLREAYSSDLDFGTGEWSVSAWINIPTSAITAEYPVYGTDLLAGAGAFTNSAGWSGLSEACTISGGSLTKTGVNTHYVSYSLPSLSLGDVILVKFDVVAVSGAIGIRIGHAPSWNMSIVPVTTTGTQYRVFTAFYVAAGNVIGFDLPGSVTATIQNLTVFRVRPSTIISRAHSGGAYFELTSLGPDFVRAVVSDGTTTRTIIAPPFTGSDSNPVLSKNTWLKIEASYRAGRLSINMNGLEIASTTNVPLLTLNNSNAVLTIGNNHASDAPFPGSITLLKLSATVPTPDQSLWMYEQEKQMFRPNAQVCLPDSNNILDLAYDDVTDRWLTVSSANKSYWSGLIRQEIVPVVSGSFSKLAASSGIDLTSRATTNPGVDIRVNQHNLKGEISSFDYENNNNVITLDYIGGFTANTTSGSAVLASVTNQSIASGATVHNALIEGTGISANTVLIATNHMSSTATATNSSVQINFRDFVLPLGYEAKEILVNGTLKQEGSTKDYIRLFDGFRETIRFAVAPGNTAWVQVQAIRSS